MASPFSIFRKHQKAFLAIAAVLAMVVFVFADLFTSWMSSDPRSSGTEVVTSWKGGKLTISRAFQSAAATLFPERSSYEY